ncbi:MAG: membrane protein insertase YidC [Gammaproteobacteria bacterium]|nr:membrane protein insertase YidC [Gammaproteobacteria bacterium]
MDNIRLILLTALCLVCLLIWQAWQKDYGTVKAPGASSTQSSPDKPDKERSDVPHAPTPAATPPGTTQPDAPLSDPAQLIRVRTDVLNVAINKQGAVMEQVKLPTYPVAADRPNEPFVLLDNTAGHYFVTQSGFRSNQPAPDHHALYEAEASEYALREGEDQLEVTLRWHSPEGLEVSKVFTFRRGTFLVHLRYEIKNEGTEAWSGRMYAQLQRNTAKDSSGMIYTYTGVAISSPEKRYEKIEYDDLVEVPIDRDITGGWAAILQHYFLAALIPDPKTPYHYYSLVPKDSDRYVIGMLGPEVQVPAGGEAFTGIDLYVGPKLQHVLEGLAPGLELTVDYGVLWFFGKPIFWLLEKLHRLTGNWGWAIVLVTVLVKLAFYQLSAMSYRSMAKMKKLTPRMTALRERYGDDKMAMNQALMEMYKEEKVNPFGGCLPILVQIPVFIALYWVLLESVELRQASFGFWIKDLSAPDPYFVLPLLMGITMMIQYKLNPKPTDPIQQRIMQALPVVFGVFFAFFPSGLVLYWLVNNLLSIAQQWMINRQYGDSPAPAGAGS